MSIVSVTALVDSFALEPAGDGSYLGHNVHSNHGVVFGGQLLGQALVAADAAVEGLSVKTLHTSFARAARPDADLAFEVHVVHAGRTFATVTVTIRQGDRLCVQSQALLSAAEDDVIRHATTAPDVAAPRSGPEPDGWQIEIVDDVDIADPALVGPAELDVWTRFDGAPADPVLNQALLAFATDGFLIGTAMRPHEGVGQAQAHKTLATGVISHTITFHEPVDASRWTLLAHRSPYAGRGRSYGTADVFDADGALVASFCQDAMIRPRDPESTAAL